MSISLLWFFVCVVPIILGNKFEDVASEYITLISSKPLDMDKIEKLEDFQLKKVMTEDFITSFMHPFKNFDKILYSKDKDKKFGYHTVECAARYKYSIDEYDFSFNIIWTVKILDIVHNVASLTLGYNWTAPSYANTSAFTETYNIPVGPLSLPGTLTMPNEAPPKAYVLMIQGSGPNDADETDYGLKPFKDIAWGLGSRNIAVFRYPKRYHMYAPPNPNNCTIEEEYMIDLEAATDLLWSKFNTPIVLIGHSLGGKMAPLLMQRKSSKIKSFITLAAAVEHTIPCLIRQYKYLWKVRNVTITDVQKQEIEDLQTVEALLEQGPLPVDYQLPEVLKDYNPSYLNSIYVVNNANITNHLEGNFLVTNGNRDYQVTLESDFDKWKENNTNPNVQFEVFPGIDHMQNLIPKYETPAPWDYYTPQNVFPKIIDTIVGFIDSLP